MLGTIEKRLAVISLGIVLLSGSTIGQSVQVGDIDPDIACKPYLPAVVYLSDSSSHSLHFGTGFLIGDGLIATAAHVVIDLQRKQYRPNMTGVVPSFFHGEHVDALWLDPDLAVPIEEARKHDVALLKANGRNADGSALSHLELDADGSATPGDQILLIGFPGGKYPPQCEIHTVTHVDGYRIIYEGISIGGASGSPMISLRSGKVVGIVTDWLSSYVAKKVPTGQSVGKDVAAIRKLLAKTDHR